MKKEKTKNDTTEQIDVVEEQVTDSTVVPKKKKKQVDEPVVSAPKPKKVKVAKAVKDEKSAVEPKVEKSLKEDKVTKFLVSMNKSVRKSIKKEAAEAGVSMNEYIVLAVEEKLGKNSL